MREFCRLAPHFIARRRFEPWRCTYAGHNLDDGYIFGGSGATGGSGSSSSGAGTVGGAGIYAVAQAGGSITITNQNRIMGGYGGFGDVNGNGADGGAGVDLVASGGGTLTVNNSCCIYGGTGGNAGAGGTTDGDRGAAVIFSGGVGIFTNSNMIVGDVDMDNYANQVTLFTGSYIYGNLNMSANTGATLTLDGTGTQNYTDAVQSGATTFAGSLVKRGSGTWVLDETSTTAVPPRSTRERCRSMGPSPPRPPPSTAGPPFRAPARSGP